MKHGMNWEIDLLLSNCGVKTDGDDDGCQSATNSAILNDEELLLDKDWR